MQFKELTITEWRQFAKVSIVFHPRLTILTGANGAGKTTILQLLARHFGWNLNFVSTYKKSSKGVFSYISDMWSSIRDSLEQQNQQNNTIGSLTYGDGTRATLTVPKQVNQSYQVAIQPQQSQSGIFVPSHRAVYVYQPLENIPTQVSARQQLLDAYLNECRARYLQPGHPRTPSYKLKESLVSLAIFGYGNQVVSPNDEAKKTFEGFQKTLQTVLPPSLGFRSLVVRIPEIVLETATGEFSFDAVSGGVAAIIDLAWQVYIASLVYTTFAVIIDEPENHLHPEIQRNLLPNFLKAFPTAQFIISTHNPFMVGAVAESNVYVLDYNAERKVESRLLDMVNKAGSSNEILREVLGLPLTMPIWVEDKVAEIVTKYSSAQVNDDTLKAIRSEMAELGLQNLFPTALSRVLGGNK